MNQKRYRWEELMTLLEPFHTQAAATARNLCRTTGDGDDLYQEAVLRACEKLHTLRDTSRFRSWFFAVLLSVHRSRSRRSVWRRWIPIDDTNAADVPDSGEGIDREAASARRMSYALSKLSAEQREAVVLFEIEGFSMEEVASIQESTVAAVKSRVLRGREKLRTIYEKSGWDERQVKSARQPVAPKEPVTEKVDRMFAIDPTTSMGKGAHHG
ncbi:MAG: RNA polymerase sigma factor [Candidatus Eisenbacteria bacterium]|uniref:RNA polymerase sigma factor n=1 Tax=Eiseniibacteriota bacterium TaxID=2212470 RepID=A0A7Y2H3E4_UNCEI|nr:RNA polymerase sigma factor [Candidatus Eisenbacteria bacterium]